MISISLKTLPDVDFPAHWLHTDGQLYFDTFSDLDIRASRRIINLDVLTDSIQRNTVERFTLPNTAKNRYFFGEDVVPDYSFLVTVYVQGIWVPYDELIVTGISDRDGTYEVELLSENSLHRLDGLGLREIDLGGMVYNQANVEDTWDGDQTALFAPVHYNQWIGLNEEPIRRTILWQDLRPLYHFKAVLEAIFNAVGYSFSSPFFDTDLGNRMFIYLLKGGWGSAFLEEEDVVELEAANVTETTINVPTDPAHVNTWRTAQPPEVTGLTQTGLDANGRWNGTAIELDPVDSAGYWNLSGQVIVRSVASDSGFTAFAIIHKYDDDNGDTQYEPVSIATATLTQNVTTDLALTFSPISTYVLNNKGGTFYLAQPVAFASALGVTFDVDLRFEFQSFLPKEGRFLNFADTLSAEFSCLDVVKSAMHLLDGILDIDDLARTVTLNPPVEASVPRLDQPGIFETVPGYFTLQSSTEVNIVPKSRLVTTEDEEYRPLLLDFRDGDDALQTFTFYQDKYQYIVGQDEDFDDPEDSQNPIFLKTLDVKMLELEQEGVTDRAILPAIWGGTEGTDLFYEELGARLLLFYGNIEQKRELNYEESVITKWPYVSQYPAQDATYYPVPLTYGLFGPTFYEENPLRSASAVEYEYLVHLELGDFYAFDFSKQVTFHYDTGTVVLQPISLNDFSNRFGGPTPLKALKLNDE